MRDLRSHPELCAINSATLGFQAPVVEVIDEIARAGFGGLALWRREMEGQDIKAIAKHIRDAGLKVTGYCRSTYFPADTRAQFEANVADNVAALQEAAQLGAENFALVVGSGKDLSTARAHVTDGIGLLLPHARALGVKLALEPLHPVYAADRSCVTSLAQALDICDLINDPHLGVLIDVYHLWWDAFVARDIARAKGRILGFHVSDWLTPVGDVLNNRGMMGDGVIDIPALRAMVETADYTGLVEVEIFSTENWWKRPMVETLGIAKERFGAFV
jgi:sugar phosphate isomerase/epimerase